jgi:hypothetical protein
MSKYYKVVVYAKRNDQPVYSYEQYDSVKVSKLSHLLDVTAYDIAKHECRSGGFSFVIDKQVGNGVIVWVTSRDYTSELTFIVKGWPL